MIGTTLQNRYRLDAELGQGGMGTVYRAYDTVLDRPVAVKVISSTTLGTEGRARLLREARAAAKLNHPNIMAVYDAGEADSMPFIVLELIEGQSLRQSPTPSFAQTIEIAKQICAALEHAHANGIIHRDLKPENVMILPSPLRSAPSEARSQGEPRERGTAHGSGVRVKLMDFGLAFASGASRLTQEGAIIGTVTYLAPELIAGQPASPASDLYALGVLLYELTAHRPPFESDTLMAVLSQHLYAPVVPPSTYTAEIPPAFDALLMHLLKKRPEERPASTEVQQRLEALGQPATVETLPATSLLDRLRRGRLVGREQEFAEATTVWRRACSGEGQVLLISGEPGIGKTRLVREVMAQARFGGAHVSLGECYAEGDAPYAPLAQMIQAAIEFEKPGFSEKPGFLTTSILADLITVAPALRATYPDVPPNPPLDALAEQQRLFESVVSFFSLLATHAPVLLVVDDVHWADSGTLSLLRHLARRTVKAQHAAPLRAPLRLLIVLAYREIELDEARAFYDVLMDLDHERLATRIKLARFDKDQTRDLLAAMFQEEITPEFLDGIYRATEGNPFFAEEVCKALIEEGKLTRESGRWKRPGMDQIQVPQSVRLVIQRRVSKLPEVVQETLRLAAVLGREFEFDTLQAMSDPSSFDLRSEGSGNEDALIEALEMAQRAQLIAETSRASRAARGTRATRVSFTFVHALIPATLHEGLGSLRRQRLHRRAAQALERIHADRLDELAAPLGRHYAEAGDSEKAIEYLLKAGDQARRVYAYDEAIEHYQQALAFLKDSGPRELPRAAHTAMNLGGLYHSVLHFEQADQAYDEAFELWQRASEAPPSSTLPASPHALRRYWDDIRTLDLTLANDANVISIVEQLFSGLVELTPDFDIVPLLARRWEILDGGQRYVFYLRRDARWSDGQPVTARDFECAWRRTLDPVTRSPNADLLYPIKNAHAIHHSAAPLDSLGIRVLDDFTLVVELEEPTGYFLQLLTYVATFAIPRHIVEAYGEAWCEVEHLVTNGPFRLAEYLRGDKLILTRNPDYRGQFNGNLTRVELTLMPVEKQSLDRYDVGEHDVSGWFPDLDMIPRARQQYASEYVNVTGAQTFYIGFDATRPPFDDVRVRQAFVHAVDRKTLAEVVLRNIVTPATGGFVPPGLPGHSPHIGLAFDPERARRLLAEAGYPQGRGFPTIEAWGLLVINDHFYRYLQTQWREHLGLEVTWQHFEWNDLDERLATHTPHLLYSAWTADYPDPDCFLRVALHQQSDCWRNEQYEQLLDAARRIDDPAERLKFYQAADRLLIQEAGIMPLAYGQRHLLIKPWVKRYPISPLKGNYWKDVIMEGH